MGSRPARLMARPVADLVGHKAPILSSEMLPADFLPQGSPWPARRPLPPGPGRRRRTLCATGDAQGLVSIWSSDRACPLLRLQGVFRQPVTDLRAGRCLLLRGRGRGQGKGGGGDGRVMTCPIGRNPYSAWEAAGGDGGTR